MEPRQGVGNRKRVHYVAPGYKKGSPVLVKTMIKAAESRGVEIISRAKLVSLITESGEPLIGDRVVDAGELNRTIRRYNEDVVKGCDSEFGRTKLLQTIDKPPFYAFECGSRIYTSYNRIEIDDQARVLNTTGRPIPGLFAAGDVVGVPAIQANIAGGGVSGITYATVCGRTAGRNASES